ncbi:MAG: efflux RND transporter periplasmic adaptor subunit [Magnetococcus sp. YQC-9]
MKKILQAMAVFVTGWLLVTTAKSALADKGATGDTERAALTVTLTQPEPATWPLTLLVSGGIFAWQEALVSSEIGGLAIAELLVDVGSEVKRGQELVKLSDETIKATLAQQKAFVARAKAAQALARSNANRVKSVDGIGAFSDQQVTQYRLTEESAEAEVAAAKAALEHEEIRLRQTRIVAADDGVISTRTATLGAVVQPGAELFRLVRQGRLEWRAEVTDGQIGRIQPGQTARLEVPGHAPIEATARQVAPTLHPESRKGLVYFDLPAGSPFKPGMFAQGAIHIGAHSALTVPQSTLVFHDGFTYLFELPKDGDRVVRRKVTTGRRMEERIEILSGLAEDARIVASGGAFLKDGDRVRVVENKP